MGSTQIIGLAAGILTACSLLPQVIKTLKEKKADDVSLVMLLVLMAGLIMWIIYGIKRDDFPIIATNCFSFLVNITMVVLRIKYKRS
jgi:MtN3 and saliva related transmembrane protein